METETKKIDKRVWIVVILLLVFTVGALIFSNLGSMNVPKTSENDRGLQAILANERENILAALTDNLTFYNPICLITSYTVIATEFERFKLL